MAQHGVIVMAISNYNTLDFMDYSSSDTSTTNTNQLTSDLKDTCGPQPVWFLFFIMTMLTIDQLSEPLIY